MWLKINVLKQEEITCDVWKVAKACGLTCGVCAFKPVLKPNRAGKFTRLYEERRPGETIEFYQDESGVQLSLNFPAGIEDIKIFFKVVEHVCYLLGQKTFLVESREFLVRQIPDVTKAFEKKSRELVAVMCHEYRAGKRKRYMVFGTMFPIVFGRKEFQRIGGSLEAFSELIDQYQRRDIAYADPYFCVLDEETKRCYGVYDVPVGEKVVIPYDPDETVNHIWYNLFQWTVNLGWVTLKYEDFIKNVPKGEYFDDAHMTLCLDEKTIDSLGSRFGYDPLTDQVVGHPTWGILIADANRHAEKVIQKNLNTEYINGYNHTALFLRWCAEHSMLNEVLIRKYPDLAMQILEEEVDERSILQEHEAFQGRLCRGHLNEAGQKFAVEYFGAGSEGYPGEVDHFAEKYFGTEKYNCEEFQDEAYLFLDYDETYRNTLGQCIERAWNESVLNRE